MRNTIVLEKDWTFYKNPQSESGEAVTLPHTWNAIDGQEERIWNLTAQR